MEDKAELLRIDVERRTTRGRVCPRCGGKIIPSRRAVYQSSGDPTAVFPAWQCERCGYEELIARAIKPAAKHGAATETAAAGKAEKKAPGLAASGSAQASPEPGSGGRIIPALKDRKGRALPPDVNRIMAELQASRTKESQ